MISAVIITKNEETMIKGCLESVKWADEIIVFDNLSTDKTVEIAREYTKRVYSEKVDNFSDHRNKAIAQAHGDWVLFVDADERVTKQLREELPGLMQNGDYAAFAISRRNFIFGEEVSYGDFGHDWAIRLLKRSLFKEYAGKIHEQPIYQGKLGYAKHQLLHFTHRNVDQIVLKSLSWSKIDAQLRLEAHHPPMKGWRFLRILFTELFNQGIKKKAFFSGTVATMDALLQTFSLLLSYIRLWENQQKPTLPERYKQLDQKLKESDCSL